MREWRKGKIQMSLTPEERELILRLRAGSAVRDGQADPRGRGAGQATA